MVNFRTKGRGRNRRIYPVTRKTGQKIIRNKTQGKLSPGDYVDSIKFHRIPEQEDRMVKYWIEGRDDAVATLGYSNQFPDEMNIRIMYPKHLGEKLQAMGLSRRTEIRGHKSAMENMTLQEFEKKVRWAIEDAYRRGYNAY
jgi:hypothetical protein